MADNYTLFSVSLENLTPESMSWASDHLNFGIVFFDEVGDGDPEKHYRWSEYQEWCGIYDIMEDEDRLSFNYSFYTSRSERSIHIYSEDSGDVEHAVRFIHQLMKRFSEDDDFFIFEAAYTCSKPRVGEFGGVAAVITKKRIKWMSTSGWANQYIENLKVKRSQKRKAG